MGITKEAELDLLLERFDDLTEEISMCGTNLEERKKLLGKRRLVRSHINRIIDEQNYSK